MKPVYLIVFALVGIASSQKAEFAKNLHACVDNPSKSLDQCLRETLEELRSVMPVGIPELNLRRTEPLEVKNLKFRDNRPLIKVDATFSDVSDAL